MGAPRKQWTERECAYFDHLFGLAEVLLSEKAELTAASFAEEATELVQGLDRVLRLIETERANLLDKAKSRARMGETQEH